MQIEELFELIENTPEPWKKYFIILSITGWRPGEFCNLKWSDINDNKIILRGKSGEREYPIIDKVGLHILPYELSSLINECRKEAQTEYFYEINHRHPTYAWLKETFAKYVKNINEKYSLYTLRHTFATQLLLAGVNILAVQKLMGHSSIQTTQIYEHIDVTNVEMLL
jgi:integrase